MIGVDLSEEMLAVADEKCSHLAENRPFFVCQPMQRLRLPEQVDSVICALDSLNYVTRPADVQKTFRRVHDALTPGGLFLFDINTPYKLEGLAGQTFLDETEDTYCVWRTEFDPKSGSAITGWICFSGTAKSGNGRSRSISSMRTRRRS